MDSRYREIYFVSREMDSEYLVVDSGYREITSEYLESLTLGTCSGTLGT